jgi:hypothetical protein
MRTENEQLKAEKRLEKRGAFHLVSPPLPSTPLLFSVQYRFWVHGVLGGTTLLCCMYYQAKACGASPDRSGRPRLMLKSSFNLSR